MPTATTANAHLRERPARARRATAAPLPNAVPVGRSPMCGAARAGFTLTEILVALAVFTVGVVGILALFAAAGQRSSMAEDLTQVSLLLDSVCDDLDAYASTPRYSPSRTATSGYPTAYVGANNQAVPSNPFAANTPPDWVQPPVSGRYTYRIWWEELPNAPGAALARITVFWGRGGHVRTFVYEKVLLVSWAS